jgi:sulfur-oxidizing protein SoxY
MNPVRRYLLKAAGAGGILAAALAASVLRPLQALAAEWNRAAFEARDIALALQSAGVADPVTSSDIVIKAPEIAENGAQVPIEILSKVPGTDAIYIFVDKNPQPLAGSFDFLNGAEPFISTRIKMGETSNVRIVARARGRHYVALREIKVTIGGCGE